MLVELRHARCHADIFTAWGGWREERASCPVVAGLRLRLAWTGVGVASALTVLRTRLCIAWAFDTS